MPGHCLPGDVVELSGERKVWTRHCSKANSLHPVLAECIARLSFEYLSGDVRLFENIVHDPALDLRDL